MEYMSIALVTFCICVLFIFKLMFGILNVHIQGMEIPGPRPLPWLGNIFNVDLQSLHLSLSELARKFGPIFRIKLLGQNFVVINDVELEKKAFGTAQYGNVFNDRPKHFWGKYVCFDEGHIFMANTDEKALEMRKMLHRSLQFYGERKKCFDRMHKKDLDQILDELERTKNEDFDLHAIIEAYSASSIVRLLRGSSSSTHDCEVMIQLLDISKYFFTGMGLVYELIPVIRFLPGQFANRYRNAVTLRDKVLDRLYHSIRDTVDPTSKGLVQKLINLQKEINHDAGTDYITDKHIKGILFDMFGATQETTASNLTNAFAIMVTHSHVAKKIQDEIDKTVGSSRMPNSSDRQNMHYTMATIYEILRYTTPIAVNFPHRASKNHEFEGYFVPKHSIILANHWHMHHDQNDWKDPWLFKPERFLDEEGKLLPPESKTRRNLIAFAYGRRRCPGEVFGIYRVFCCLTAVLQKFDIVAASDGTLPISDPRCYNVNGVSIMVKPYLCRAKLRC